MRLLILLIVFSTGLCAQSVPVRVSVEIDASKLALTGRAELALAYTVDEDLDQAYAIHLALLGSEGLLMRRDHSPPRSTKTWKKGETIRYPLPLRIPMERAGGKEYSIILGFHEPESGKTLPPDDGGRGRFGMGAIGSLEVPEMERGEGFGTEAVDALIETARTWAKEGRSSDAYDLLSTGIRRCSDDELKTRIARVVMGIKALEARPIDAGESRIVQQRIESERQRYLRQIAGRLYDRKAYHAALAILDEVGGKLAEAADAAVIGALSDAKRVEKDRQDIKRRLLDHIEDEDKELAKSERDKHGSTPALFKRALNYIKKGNLAIARNLLRSLRFAETQSERDEAYAKLKEVEARMLEEMPARQRRSVDEAVGHPCWGRTSTRCTQEFIIIGPRDLLSSISDESALRFDLAYVLQTDLFGRRPNPGGDRVTVYFKELWEFGGGVGGGKTIDIGRAQPSPRRTRVDTGLLYHELGHCVDDTTPIYAGFREGLANFAAAYTHELLGQDSDSLHSFNSNLEAFEKDYLARDLEFWRIQNYGPSAGFFLWFVERYAKQGQAHDWSGYRQFFREYRSSRGRDGRERQIVRALAFHLMRSFGDQVFDDLVSFRFPLIESDREAIRLEIDRYERRLLGQEDDFESYENSPIPRDELYSDLDRLARGRPDDARAFAFEELGILSEWWVIGPFRAPDSSPDACIFPPEYEVDFDKRYETPSQICRWSRANRKAPVTLTSRGWVKIDYAYQENTASYGICWIDVIEDIDAMAHLRGDDDISLFVQDELVGKYASRGNRMARRRGEAALIPDAMQLPLRLKAGRNKVLVKVRNNRGPAGFSLALTRRDGSPIPGLSVDLDGEKAESERESLRFKRHFRHRFESRSFRSKLDVAVGSFRVRQKRLVGESQDRGVAWRKYTVRPGFPKDSPSNLAWLKRKVTKGLDAFRLEIGLRPEGNRAPKIGVCFQSEGEKDGLSGWTLVLLPASEGRVTARLERYDRLVYQSPPKAWVAPEKGEAIPLFLEYAAGRLKLRLGAETLLDDISIRPIPERDRIGFMTWGPRVGIESIELSKPAKR